MLVLPESGCLGFVWKWHDMQLKGRNISKNIISQDQVLHTIYLTESLPLFMELQGHYLMACHKSIGYSVGSSMHYLYQLGLLTFGVMVWQINQVPIYITISLQYHVNKSLNG